MCILSASERGKGRGGERPLWEALVGVGSRRERRRKTTRKRGQKLVVGNKIEGSSRGGGGERKVSGNVSANQKKAESATYKK